MAVGRNTQAGEVYKISIWRTQEQELEVEIEADGVDPLEIAWETAEESDWNDVEQGYYEINQITCGGEI